MDEFFFLPIIKQLNSKKIIFYEAIFNWHSFTRCSMICLRWLNTVLRAASGNSRDGACVKFDQQTWRKKQWYTEDDFPKTAH